MRQIEPIAAYVPYMTCPGNHEEAYNFSNYVNRFTMPSRDGGVDGGDNNHFYSVNVGPVHVVSFSTEFYFFVEYGFAQIERQYDWLVKDLQVRYFFFELILSNKVNLLFMSHMPNKKEANRPENRAKRPCKYEIKPEFIYFTVNIGSLVWFFEAYF